MRHAPRRRQRGARHRREMAAAALLPLPHFSRFAARVEKFDGASLYDILLLCTPRGKAANTVECLFLRPVSLINKRFRLHRHIFILHGSPDSGGLFLTMAQISAWSKFCARRHNMAM